MKNGVSLPHAYPFLFHSRTGDGGSLTFAPSSNDFTSRGGNIPVWVVIEAFAQAAGLMSGSEGTHGGVLVQVTRFRCPHPPLPGEEWSISGKLLKRMGPLIQMKVTGKCGRKIRAGGVFTLREDRG